MHSNVSSHLSQASVSICESPAKSARLLLTFGSVTFAGYWALVFNAIRVDWSVNPQYYYGWFVPVLALGLFLLRWNSRPASSAPGTNRPVLAFAIVALAALLPIRLIEEANPEWRLIQWTHALQMVFLTLSLLYWIGGRPWTRRFAFPVCFLLVAVPWPVPLEATFVQTLMRVVAGITVEAVGFINIPAVQHGNIIQISSGLVGIDEACSGVRSLQTAFFICLFLGELYRFSLKNRFWLIIAGFIAALVCNVGRTFFLVWSASHQGLARMHQLHDMAGEVVLIATLVLIWIMAQLFRRSVGQTFLSAGSADFPVRTSAQGDWKVATIGRQECLPYNSQPRIIPLKPLVAILCWGLFAEALTQAWYRSHETASVANAHWSVDWPERNSQEVRIDDQVRSMLRYTDGRQQAWEDHLGNQWHAFFFRWAPGRNSAQLASAHTPDICFRGAGYHLANDVGLQSLPLKDITLPFRQYVFTGGVSPLHVFYCRWEDQLNQPHQSLHEDGTQLSRLRAVLAGRRHLGQQVLEITLSGPETAQDAWSLFERQASKLIRR